MWLKNKDGNVQWTDLPDYETSCRIIFPRKISRTSSESGHGVLLHLNRLNVPCQEGHLLFTGISNTTDYHLADTWSVCGKLEELREPQRTVYFPGNDARPTHVTSYGKPVFSFTYRLVDHCHNVTFTTPNASYQLSSTHRLDCSFNIHLPYGNRVILRLEISGEGGEDATDCHEEGLQVCEVSTKFNTRAVFLSISDEP